MEPSSLMRSIAKLANRSLCYQRYERYAVPPRCKLGIHRDGSRPPCHNQHIGLSKPCMLQAPGGPELCSEPVENVAEALHAMARLAAPRQLVVLAGKAHEPHLTPHLLQGRKELLRLFNRAAQVLFAVQEQQRRTDVLHVGNGRVAPV